LFLSIGNPTLGARREEENTTIVGPDTLRHTASLGSTKKKEGVINATPTPSKHLQNTDGTSMGAKVPCVPCVPHTGCGHFWHVVSRMAFAIPTLPPPPPPHPPCFPNAVTLDERCVLFLACTGSFTSSCTCVCSFGDFSGQPLPLGVHAGSREMVYTGRCQR